MTKVTNYWVLVSRQSSTILLKLSFSRIFICYSSHLSLFKTAILKKIELELIELPYLQDTRLATNNAGEEFFVEQIATRDKNEFIEAKNEEDEENTTQEEFYKIKEEGATTRD